MAGPNLNADLIVATAACHRACRAIATISHMDVSNSQILLTGASGMVGRAIHARLERHPGLIALTRNSIVESHAATRQISGDLFADAIAFDGHIVLSAGPLDGLVAWLKRETPRQLHRVVALSSTSIHVKRDSDDRAERELALRLETAEEELRQWCAQHSVPWTILRPTLIWNDVFEGALSSFVSLARRLHLVVLPAKTHGLRQPVHADDVAAAMLAALDQDVSHNRSYDLPGGETINYRSMVARMLASTAPAAVLLTMSNAWFECFAPLTRRLGALRGLTPAVIARMNEDLLFDRTPALQDLQVSLRSFVGRAAENSEPHGH